MLDELENRIGEKKVNKTIAKLAPAYKLPVKPQPINLFYLEDHLRTKIEYNGEQGYKIGERSNIDVETLKSELSNNLSRAYFTKPGLYRRAIRNSLLAGI